MHTQTKQIPTETDHSKEIIVSLSLICIAEATFLVNFRYD